MTKQESQAKYRATHAEELKASSAAYREKHKEENKAYRKAYNIAHKEEKRAHAAAYFSTHREEYRQRLKEWRRAHPEETRASRSRRRSRELGAEGTHTAADIKAIYDKQAGHCYWCGIAVGKKYHVDHFYPLSKGGTNWPDNLVISCPTCNTQKHAKTPDEWLMERRDGTSGHREGKVLGEALDGDSGRQETHPQQQDAGPTVRQHNESQEHQGRGGTPSVRSLQTGSAAEDKAGKQESSEGMAGDVCFY